MVRGVGVKTLFAQLVTAAATMLLAGAAQAAEPCRGKAPGGEIHGPVLHVVDGERLCVALGDSPDRWVELALAPLALEKAAASAAPSRGALMGVAFAQNATCTVVGRQGGVPLARCRIGGQDVAALVRSPQAVKISRAWR